MSTTATGAFRRQPLRPGAVAEFDQLLHELNPDAARVSAERLEGLCHWLAALPAATARDVLDRRLQRLEEMRAMRDDPDWDLQAPTRQRLDKLLAYLDRDDDLIPDHEPLFGRLDDVLLLELAWPAFAIETDEYRDFSDYRAAEKPHGNGGERRAAWVRDRLAEIALWRHHLRVNDDHYAERGQPAQPFRIG
jgi:uncharacterized membrane protein YkvA (DUF1232 family)